MSPTLWTEGHANVRADYSLSDAVASISGYRSDLTEIHHQATKQELSVRSEFSMMPKATL